MVAAPTGGSGRALVWSGVLMVVVLALGAMLLVTRWLYVRWLRARADKAFSMRSLEEMRRSGLISEEEFVRLRRGALGLGRADEEKGQTMSNTDEKLDDETTDAAGSSGSREDEEHS